MQNTLKIDDFESRYSFANTACPKGPVKKYLPIAWARKKPIT